MKIFHILKLIRYACLYACVLSIVALTNSNAKILSFPEKFQEKDQWSWAASCESILSYYGVGISQCEIAEFTRNTADWHSFGSYNCCSNSDAGCNYWNYAFAANGSIQSILFHFANISSNGVNSNISTDDINQQINNNKPIIINWTLKQGGNQFIVVYGIDANSIYYMNPLSGEGCKIADYDWIVNDGNHTWTSTLILQDSPVANISISGMNKSNFCLGDYLKAFVNFSGNFDTSNVVSIQISDTTGFFNDNSIILGTKKTNKADTIGVVIPFDIKEGNYRIRAISSNPADTSNICATAAIIRKFETIAISGDTQACHYSKETYKVVAKNNYSYKWTVDNGTIYGPDNASMVNVIWDKTVGQGKVYVTATSNASQCYQDDSLETNVIELPTAEITGNLNSCQYYTENYTSSLPAKTYKWRANGGTIVGSDSSKDVKVYWEIIGYGSLSLTVTNENSCADTLTKSVYLSSSPENLVIRGSQEICLNKWETYSTDLIPNFEYQWKVTGGTTISNLHSYSISVHWDTLGTGRIELKVTNTSSGCIGNLAKIIGIHEYPVATHSAFAPVCVNDTPFKLSGGNPSGGAYSGDGVDKNIFDPSEAGVGTHNIYYIYYNEYGCSDTVETSLQVMPNPSQPVISINGTQLLSSADRGNQWYKSGKLINGATEKAYTPTVSGHYTVEVTNENTCKSPMSDSTYFAVKPSGISEEFNEIASVYPNPANENLNIHLSNSCGINTNVELIDIMGNVKQSINSSGNDFSFDTRNQAEGMYLIKITRGVFSKIINIRIIH